MYNKQDIVDATKVFIEKYKRLPLMPEDDLIFIEKKDDDIKERPLRASIQIKSVFGDSDGFVEHLLSNGIISYRELAKKNNTTPTIIKNIINNNTKTPDPKIRRALEVFFCRDFAKGYVSEYHSRCDRCKFDCKQHYFVELRCKKYKRK